MTSIPHEGLTWGRDTMSHLDLLFSKFHISDIEEKALKTKCLYIVRENVLGMA